MAANVLACLVVQALLMGLCASRHVTKATRCAFYLRRRYSERMAALLNELKKNGLNQKSMRLPLELIPHKSVPRLSAVAMEMFPSIFGYIQHSSRDDTTCGACACVYMPICVCVCDCVSKRLVFFSFSTAEGTHWQYPQLIDDSRST